MLNKCFLSILFLISIPNILGEESTTIKCFNGTAIITNDTNGQYEFLGGSTNVTCTGQCFIDFSSKTPTVNDKIEFGCISDCQHLTQPSGCCNSNDYCNFYNPTD